VFVDYDNIEIGLKSTLRREFDVSIPLEALKERGDIVAKFAYANWGRQESAAPDGGKCRPDGPAAAFAARR
jgi:hypothetical protein